MGICSPLNSKLLAAIVGLIAIVFPFSANAAQKKNAQPSPALRQKSPESDETPLRPEDIEEQKREAARAAFVKRMRTVASAEVESAAKSVKTPDPVALSKALGVESSAQAGAELEAAARSAFRQLGDLDGDGTPEAVFRWSRAERYKASVPEDLGGLTGWVMFLFSWDGARWRVSELMPGHGLSGVETLSGIWEAEAVVVVEGLSSMPYPVVFRFQGHAATVAWDSRSGESRYQAYARGAIQFQEREGGPPVMIASGRADPGVIQFSPNGNRGFEAATAYLWENDGYVPKKTEFEENEDYTLYRFLAALHMRDFRAAFSLIDAAAFLDGSVRTPEALRQRVEKDWPEFTGNAIFVAVESPSDGPNQFTFELNRGDLHYSYFPTFGKDGSLRLTGFERRKAE